MGGKERTGRPAISGGPHPKDRNEEEDPGPLPGLRPAAAGLEGSDAHPARPEGGKQPHRAKRDGRKPAHGAGTSVSSAVTEWTRRKATRWSEAE